MYDNPFVASLDDLLAWLLVPDGAGWLTLRIVGVVFFEVILPGTAGAGGYSIQVLTPFVIMRMTRIKRLIYSNLLTR